MLSYNHEHLAWKQRIRKEIITSNDYYDYLKSTEIQDDNSRASSRQVLESSTSSKRRSSLPSTRSILNKIKTLESELELEQKKTKEVEEEIIKRGGISP